MSGTQSKRTAVKTVTNAFLWSDGTITIENVRLSHPNVVKPYESTNDAGQKTQRWGVVGILPKETHKDAAKLVLDQINKMMKEDLKVDRLAADRKFLKDGDLAEKDEYDGSWTVSAGDSKNAPRLRDENGNVVTDERKFYGGCYGSILIRPWPQNDAKYGKRVNAGLVAVKFLRDGEPFGSGRISDDEIDNSFGDGGDGFDDPDDGLGDL